jgi:hypothetical protein
MRKSQSGKRPIHRIEQTNMTLKQAQVSLKINMLITVFCNDLYYIRAAQNGYINRALQAGIAKLQRRNTNRYRNAFRVRYCR